MRTRVAYDVIGLFCSPCISHLRNTTGFVYALGFFVVYLVNAFRIGTWDFFFLS